jgi:hypothetical protein
MEPDMRWPGLGVVAGDQLYQFGEQGPPTTLANGTPFVQWAEGTWSRYVITGSRPALIRLGDYLSLPTVGPSVRIRIAVHNGRPELDEIEVIRPEGCPEITAALLSELPLSEIIERFIYEVGRAAFWTEHLALSREDRLQSTDSRPLDQLVSKTAGRSVESEEDFIRVDNRLISQGEAAGQSARKMRRRRVVTDELLQDVARIYTEDRSGAPTKAVSDELFTSHRNATRWVALARERGLLDPYGEGN